MTFDDDAMDSAQRCLETTKKFCTSHNKKFAFFSSSSTPSLDKLSIHERIHRRCIVADCLLFEAIVVFLKQGITSYVKGGYLLRKAWKAYEKIYQEMEQLCSCPSPISRTGTLSPTDRHVGTSIYDKKFDTQDVINDDDEQENAESTEGVGESLSALHVGFASFMISGDTCSSGEDKCADRPPSPSHCDVETDLPVGLGANQKPTKAYSAVTMDGSLRSEANGMSDRSMSTGQIKVSSSEQVNHVLDYLACLYILSHGNTVYKVSLHSLMWENELCTRSLNDNVFKMKMYCDLYFTLGRD